MTNDGGVYGPLIESWQLDLRAGNKAAKTIEAYSAAAAGLAQYMANDRGGDTGWESAGRAEVRAYLADQAERWAASTANQRYRGLVQFFKWLVAEGEITVNPMDGIKPPQVPDKPIPLPEETSLANLLRELGGNDFESRRDLAIIALFVDSGARRAEIAGISVDDLDLNHREVTVFGKGRRERTLPYGAQTARALDRYLRVRRRHSLAHLDALWLATKNRPPLKANGIYQMVRRRGAAAGLPDLHPHQLRHLFAHLWLDSGGSETHLMALAGWRSRSMVGRYAASAAAARARREAAKIGVLDKLTSKGR